MTIPSLFKHEKYRCNLCDITLEEISVIEEWKCPSCNNSVTIYAEDYKGKRHTVNRLRPSEVRKDFWIAMPDFENMHSVIEITQENQRYRIALKEFGVMQYPPDALLNCVTGSWTSISE